MEEALIKRVLPHSVEAEQSVIGSMIMDRDAIMTASEVITSEDFYQSQYGVLFDAMLELYNEGKPVDLVTLPERLMEKDVPPLRHDRPGKIHAPQAHQGQRGHRQYLLSREGENGGYSRRDGEKDL